MTLDAVALDVVTSKSAIELGRPAKQDLAIAALAKFQPQEQPKTTGSTADDLVVSLLDFREKLLRLKEGR